MNTKFKKILLWIFVGLLSLGQLQRIELIGELSGINIYFHDIFILFWLINFLFTNFTYFMRFTKGIKTCEIINNYKIEVFFTTIVIISTLLNIFTNHDFISLLYIARLLSYILFAISLRDLIIKNKIRCQDLRFKMFGVGFIILILGYLQLIFVKDTRFLSILGWDDHFHRLISTIFDPGFTGIILVTSFLYSLTLKKINKISSWIITLSFLWGIALTFSRATYLSLIVSLLGLILIKIAGKLFYKKDKTTNLARLSSFYDLSSKTSFSIKEVLLIILTFILMIFATPKPGGEGVDLSRTTSITARQSSLKYQISLLDTKTLLIGNGLFSKQNSLSNFQIPNQLISANLIPSHSRIPDNFFINILLSTGMIGTILAVYILFRWSIRIARIDPIMGLVILSILIHSQFNNSLLQPFVLLILLGGIASLKKDNSKV